MIRPTLVTLLKTVTLVLGGLITYHAVTAYRRTGSRSLRALAVGFGVVTVGAALAGLIDLLAPVGVEAALAVESTFTAVGFGAILYSLYRG
ncbi:MAG: hypothetical protein ABEJ43_00130 [Haloferacaceae archaeon]